MTSDVTLFVYGLTGLLMALVAGVFLAFSDFVMRSLSAASPRAGVEAMQLINRKVYSSVFLVWLLGLAPVSAILSAYAWAFVSGPAQIWFVAGGALYFLGTFMVTILCNVPMNNRLDGMATDGAATQAYWTSYATAWTMWNHVRTAASALAAASFMIGCILYA